MLKIVDACGVSYRIEDTQAAKDEFIQRMNEHKKVDAPEFRLEPANHAGEFFLFSEKTDVMIKVRLFSAASVSRTFIIRKDSTVAYLTRLCGCVYWPWPNNPLLNERFSAKIIGLEYEVTEDMKIQDLVAAKVPLCASTVKDNRYFVVRIQHDSVVKAAKINVGETLRVSDLVTGYHVIWDGQELSPHQRLETLDLCPERGLVEIVESRRNRGPKSIMPSVSDPLATFYKYANMVLMEQEEMLDAVVYYSKKV